METVDLASWPRRELFEFFSPISNPFYSVTFRLDVTEAAPPIPRRGACPFTTALIWLCTRAMERVDAFSYAICDGQVVRLESRRPSFTHLKARQRAVSDRHHALRRASWRTSAPPRKEKAEKQDFLST